MVGDDGLFCALSATESGRLPALRGRPPAGSGLGPRCLGTRAPARPSVRLAHWVWCCLHRYLWQGTDSSYDQGMTPMRRSLLLLFPLLLAACDNASTDPSVANDLATSVPISIKVGDSWLYRRWQIEPGRRALTGVPDTLVAYKFVQAVVETSIAGSRFVILEGRIRTVDSASIGVTYSREAIHADADGVLSVNVGFANSWSEGLLGRAASAPDFDSLVVRVGKALPDWSYSTVPIRLPLSIGSETRYWPEASYGDTSMKRIYVGSEEIVGLEGKTSCWKFGTRFQPFYGRITDTTWIGPKGLVLDRTTWDTDTFTDASTGKPVIHRAGSAVTQWIGTYDIGDKLLKPWGE